MAAGSELLWDRVVAKRKTGQDCESHPALSKIVPTGPTEGMQTVRVSLAQSFFVVPFPRFMKDDAAYRITLFLSCS